MKYQLVFEDVGANYEISKQDAEELVERFNAFLKGDDALFVLPPGTRIESLDVEGK